MSKRPIDQDDLQESMAEMSISPKRRMLEIDILPPIRILDREPQLPKLTLNPEHSQLILYKTLELNSLKDICLESLKENSKDDCQEMEWE